MKTTTSANPQTTENKPWFLATSPNVGPMISSSTIFVGAGKEPALRTLARSLASSGVKFPEICELPFGISPLTDGAEYTVLSRTIAILPFGLLLDASAVHFAQMRVPVAFMFMLTAG